MKLFPVFPWDDQPRPAPISTQVLDDEDIGTLRLRGGGRAVGKADQGRVDTPLRSGLADTVGASLAHLLDADGLAVDANDSATSLLAVGATEDHFVADVERGGGHGTLQGWPLGAAHGFMYLRESEDAPSTKGSESFFGPRWMENGSNRFW